MEIKDMQMADIEVRSAELAEMMTAEGADIEQIQAEVTELEERKAQIVQEAEARKAQLEEVVKTSVEIEESIEEERKMEEMITRNSPEYGLAFAKYIQTGNEEEVRGLLTENASGTIAVPEYVYEEIKTAWEEEGIMSRVRKSYLKGNLKVGFEISGEGAVLHSEGVAVDEENLILGIVELKPVMIKKWISISKQALRIDQAEAYLRHVYRELAHHIAEYAANTFLAKIEACGTVSTTTCVGVPVLTDANPGIATVAKAMGLLSAQASSPVAIMNRQTYADIKAAALGANFPADPFDGLPVLFNNSITAASVATTGVTYMIVGDLQNGALWNFPDGEGIDVLADPYTLATSNMTRFIGDLYVAMEPIAPNAFVKVQK